MKMIPPFIVAFLSLILTSAGDEPSKAPTHGKAEHVVMIVWDGMRPDFATEQYAPNLYALSKSGVFFQRNHSAYVTSTEVNGTVLATGVYPNRSHLIANREYRPEIDPLTSFGTETQEAIHKGDIAGKYLGVPTLEEILQKHGDRTVIAGTKAVALLPDRSENRGIGAATDSVVIYNGKSLPESAISDATNMLGIGFPAEVTFPNTDEDLWTTRALTVSLWKEGLPKFSLLWMSDPDFSQHNTAPGSPIAVGAIKSVDDNLGLVIKALRARGELEKTDIIVVSDHGFSTIETNTNVISDLTKAGFPASDKYSEPPKTGDIIVASVSGSLLLYVTGHDTAGIQKLVDFFQQWEATGVIFTKEKMKGAFTLEQGRLNSPEAPDILVSLRWDEHPNKYGVPGSIHAEIPRKVGQGMHATLSKFDIHNTLIAAGPDFKHGMVDDLPTGNVDVAPTILWLLGVPPAEKPDGRVLFEAISGMPDEKLKFSQTTLTAQRNEEGIEWRQYLKFTQLGPYIYLEEGNGGKPESMK